jgi:hypothetical protein
MQFCCVLSLTQLTNELAITDRPGDRGESGDMLGVGIGWDQQQEHKIDRLAIDRLKVDGSRQSREQPKEGGEALYTGMRQREPVSQAGGTQLLAVSQRAEDRPGVDPDGGRRAAGQLGQELWLVLNPQGGEDVGGCDQVGDAHGYVLEES